MDINKNWKIKWGDFLFRFRSFTPLPLILMAFLVFNPKDLGKYNLVITLAGMSVTILGQLIRIVVVGFSQPGTSGREKFLKADQLNESGLYSITRNPLYLGNILIYLGLLLVFSNPFALVLLVLFLILQYYFIILAEEYYLQDKYGPEYSQYAERVPRLIPRFKAYSKAILKFDLKKVVFKENDSVFNQVVMFILILVFKEYKFSGRVDRVLIYILASAVLIVLYIFIKILKKRNSANNIIKKE